MLAYEKHERDIANLLGGRLTVSSGRGKTDKSDVKTATHNVECKYTEKDYYTLSVKTWEKVRREAQREFREPMMAIRLKNNDFIITEHFVSINKGKELLSKRIKCDGIIELATGKFCYGLKIQRIEEYLEDN